MFSSFHHPHPTHNPFPVSDPFLTVTISLPDSCSSVLKLPLKYTKCRSLPRSSNGRKRVIGLGVTDKVARDSRTFFFFFLFVHLSEDFVFLLLERRFTYPSYNTFCPKVFTPNTCMSDLPKTFPDTLEIPRVQTNIPKKKKKNQIKSRLPVKLEFQIIVNNLIV